MPRRRNDLAAFSPKQLELLTWWTGWSPHRGKDAVICHGAVRSGKTFCMGLSFITWAMEGWDGQSGLAFPAGTSGAGGRWTSPGGAAGTASGSSAAGTRGRPPSSRG